MKKVTLFVLRSCPYCVRALNYLDTLKKENPSYANIVIEQIDEGEHPEIANKFDYWYVPTFYIDNVKHHEGVPTLEKVENVLKAALQ